MCSWSYGITKSCLSYATSDGDDLESFVDGKIAQNVSQELAAKGGNLALFTGFDVLRDPRWGRSEECFSEDAYLTSQMIQSAVQGFEKIKTESALLSNIYVLKEPVKVDIIRMQLRLVQEN